MTTSDLTSAQKATAPSQGRSIELYIFFPLFTVVITALIWWSTLHLISVERTNAENSAENSVQKLTETYESQVVRALREIDHDLRDIQYVSSREGAVETLAQLESHNLLPPAFLFAVGIFDPQGQLVATNHPFTRDFTIPDYSGATGTESMKISLPMQDPQTGEWTLHFIRRLFDENNAVAGYAVMEVGAGFFVSVYDVDKLGNEGVLGILGTDGVFRVKRTGESIDAGQSTSFHQIVPSDYTEDSIKVSLLETPWDGIARYTGARQLYDFPVAVVVGVSRAEQLAATNQTATVYKWRAAAATLVFLLVMGLLWRLNFALARSRHREMEAHIAHAKQVEYLAFHDNLTGLPNRSMFSKLLDHSIKYARRYEKKLAVLFLDLDHFKHINDTLGHEAGDNLLVEVANRLTGSLRESDTVARLGGDEFVIILPELDDDGIASVTARKLITAIAAPYTLLDQEVRITVSVGISIFPNDGEDEQTLTKNADLAMYQAKEQGRNDFQYYSEKLRTETLERLSLESSMQNALARDEFRLFYQGKWDIDKGKITGMEALLRWQHPDLGVIPPLKFMKLAEETGLILPIGKWVIKTACQQNVSWQKQGFPKLVMSVNLSPKQFYDDHLTEFVTSVLKETGMDPQLLELEIIESLLMQDVEKAMTVLEKLKAIGIRIAIDDFGIGYSSLALLKKFPLDAIKIDRSFIRSVNHVHNDNPLSEAIFAMGQTLSLNVVAQGVETQEQADYLRAIHCNEAQGYYFNKPVSGEEFSALLEKQPAAGITPSEES